MKYYHEALLWHKLKMVVPIQYRQQLLKMLNEFPKDFIIHVPVDESHFNKVVFDEKSQRFVFMKMQEGQYNMTNQELDNMINWCKNKIKTEKNKPFGSRLTGKRFEGYEEAMHQIMSYLHLKKDNKRGE